MMGSVHTKSVLGDDDYVGDMSALLQVVRAEVVAAKGKKNPLASGSYWRQFSNVHGCKALSQIGLLQNFPISFTGLTHSQMKREHGQTFLENCTKAVNLTVCDKT